MRTPRADGSGELMDAEGLEPLVIEPAGPVDASEPVFDAGQPSQPLVDVTVDGLELPAGVAVPEVVSPAPQDGLRSPTITSIETLACRRSVRSRTLARIEPMALFGAVARGVGPVALAVSSHRTSGELTFSCGACLQVALELAGPELTVVAADLDGDMATARVGDLLVGAPRRHTFRAAPAASER